MEEQLIREFRRISKELAKLASEVEAKINDAASDQEVPHV